MLSKRAKYALNALRELARSYQTGPLTAAVIAERGRIPLKFLEVILLDLNRAHMITSKRGRGGGHELHMRIAIVGGGLSGTVACNQLQCTTEGAAIDGAGRVSDNLFLLGPLCQATLWESTAVPEIRDQVAQLVRQF